ncbi:hypothetical protein [Streptomyces altiplanensis]
MTDTQPDPADSKQPDSASTTPGAPTVPPIPDTTAAATIVPAPATKPSTRRTLTTLLIGAVAGAASVGGTWYITSHDTSSSDSTPTAGTPVEVLEAEAQQEGTFTLTGDFTLTDGAISDDTGGCEGSGGYEDIELGTSVTVYDAGGSVIATSSLILSEFDEAAETCTYDVAVDDVPADEDFYQVEIGHRGKLQLSAEEAKSGGFSGSLGND